MQGKVVRTNQAPQEVEETKELHTKLFCKACNIGFKSKNKLTAHRKTLEHQNLNSEYMMVKYDVGKETK